MPPFYQILPHLFPNHCCAESTWMFVRSIRSRTAGYLTNGGRRTAKQMTEMTHSLVQWIIKPRNEAKDSLTCFEALSGDSLQFHGEYEGCQCQIYGSVIWTATNRFKQRGLHITP